MVDAVEGQAADQSWDTYASVIARSISGARRVASDDGARDASRSRAGQVEIDGLLHHGLEGCLDGAAHEYLIPKEKQSYSVLMIKHSW